MKLFSPTSSFILLYVKKYRFLLFISALLSLLTVALTLYIPILIGDAIDLIVAPGLVDFGGISKIILTAIAVIFVVAPATWVMNAINNRIAYHVARDIRTDAFLKLQRLPLSYFDTNPRGTILNKVIANVDQLSDGLLLGFSQLFTGVITIIGTLVFMIITKWEIALAVALLTPISLFVARFISKSTYNMFKLQTKTRGEQTSVIEETVSNESLVIAFSRGDEQTRRFDEVNERLRDSSLKAIFFSSLTNPTTRFVNSVIYAAVALIGSLAAIATAGATAPFTVGMLSRMLAYTNQYTKPFNEIGGVIAEFQNALACASEISGLINEEPEAPDAEDARVLENAEGNISMQGVSFSYTPQQRLIENLNLDVSAGARVAIVGPTGSGKTTLINLLMRFYDINGGVITLDGQDIRGITRKSLRQGFGMVLQDTWLRCGTVRENIAFAKPDATTEEIILAAKAAHAHSFITRLPNGYDTLLDDSGASLSQGQKQLLCIARIMLSIPPMLILDEATSSIDTRTESKIQKAFISLMRGRTSFIVAHRLSTIKEADVILVMRDGAIVEQGRHNELLELGGFYAELYNSRLS